MRKLVRILWVVFLLVSCGSYSVYVVTPVNYKELSYRDKVRYLGALHTANQINLTNRSYYKGSITKKVIHLGDDLEQGGLR